LQTRCQWLLTVVLATQEAEIGRVAVRTQLRQQVTRPYLKKKKKKKNHKTELMEWFKVWALSSNPSIAKKKKKG
jgi:hypothetical protein